MDYNSKYQFYSEIYNDYNNNHEKSFIFRYFKEQKDNKMKSGTGKANSSRYVTLRGLYGKYLDREISQHEMAAALEDFAGDLTRKEMQGLLPEEPDGLSKKKLTERLREEIGNDLGVDELHSDGITIRLIECLATKYIDEDIWNFFYNTGINNPKGGRRTDDALDMLFEFAAERKKESGKEKSSTSDRLRDGDYVANCTELYDLLNDIDLDDGQTVFVPVVIDPDTGLGLYMIGGDIISPDEKDERNCYYCILRFDYDDACFGEYSPEGFWDDYGRTKNRTAFRMMYCVENKGRKYTNIEDAIKGYMTLKGKRLDYEGYEFVNEAVADEIRDSDVEELLKYFIPPDEIGELVESRRKEALRAHEIKRSYIKKKQQEKRTVSK